MALMAQGVAVSVLFLSSPLLPHFRAPPTRPWTSATTWSPALVCTLLLHTQVAVSAVSLPRMCWHSLPPPPLRVHLHSAGFGGVALVRSCSPHVPSCLAAWRAQLPFPHLQAYKCPICVPRSAKESDSLSCAREHVGFVAVSSPAIIQVPACLPAVFLSAALSVCSGWCITSFVHDGARTELLVVRVPPAGGPSGGH